MPAAAQIRKNFSLYVDGFGFAGNVDEYTPPVLASQVEDYRAGGMDTSVAVEMGQEKMEASFKISSISPEVLRLWGVAPGTTVPLIVRGALEDIGTNEITVEKFTQRGTIRSVEWDAITPGAKAGLTFTMDVREFQYELNGSVIHDIDVLNMKRIVNGVDRLEQLRAAIGIG